MIKQIILFQLLTWTTVGAMSIESEIGIDVGLTSTKNDVGSRFNHPTMGLNLKYNNYVIMPRLDLEYVKLKDEQASSLLKGSINGIYEFENKTIITPYVLAGLGYENVQGGTENVLESHAFMQGGGGVRIDMPHEYKAKLEGRFLQVFGGENEENEAIVTAGVVIPLGSKKLVKSVVKPKIIRKKRVLKQPKPLPISRVVYINKNECSIKTRLPDLDRDGVEDRLDQCPATPCNFSVDSYGCPVKTTLKVNFKSGSSELTTLSMSKISRFANFLLKNKGSRVKIVGHTDSFGSSKDNLLLSQRRAYAIVRSLITKGVSAGRVFAEGKGESIPIASNETVEGRAENRRIEAELSYPRGRK